MNKLIFKLFYNANSQLSQYGRIQRKFQRIFGVLEKCRNYYYFWYFSTCGIKNYQTKVCGIKLIIFNKKMFFIVSVTLLFVLSSGCGQITGNAVKELPKENAGSPEIYFCPREDCGKVYESKIILANSTVHCALYDINLKNVISSLAQKSKIIDVMVVMDASNDKKQVKGEGVRFNGGQQQLMHNKFCVIDGYTVITGSFNPTENDNYRNNNNVEVIYSSILAKNYEDEFEELWSGKFGTGSKVKNPAFYINNMEIENYFCPEDNCAPHIASLINSANSSVYFMAYSFTSEEIANAIINKNNKNVPDIRGIFDAEQSSSKFSQLKRLQGFGINAKKDRNKYKMHHKVFIIDNETVATGSFNPTSSADTKNDENLVVMHDKNIAKHFLEEFDSLWN